jgi:cation transport ATPase
MAKSAVVALLSLIAVAVAVHLVLFGWKASPPYRVDLAPRQRLWVGALFVGPISLGGLIVVFREALLRFFTERQLGAAVVYLVAFVMAVVFGIMPTAPDDEDDGQS